jgi:hypothetical protein
MFSAKRTLLAERAENRRKELDELNNLPFQGISVGGAASCQCCNMAQSAPAPTHNVSAVNYGKEQASEGKNQEARLRRNQRVIGTQSRQCIVGPQNLISLP